MTRRVITTSARMQQENTIMEIENVIHVQSERKLMQEESLVQPHTSELYMNDNFLNNMSVEDLHKSIHDISHIQPNRSFGLLNQGEGWQERVRSVEQQWRQKVEALQEEMQSLKGQQEDLTETIQHLQHQLAQEKHERHSLEQINKTLQNNFLQQKDIVTALNGKYRQEVQNQQKVIEDYFSIIEDFRRQQTQHLEQNSEMEQHNAQLESRLRQLQQDSLLANSQNKLFQQQMLQMHKELSHKEEELEHSKKQFLLQQSQQKGKQLHTSAKKSKAGLDTEVQLQAGPAKSNLKALITQLSQSQSLPSQTFDTFEFSLQLSRREGGRQSLLRLMRVLLNCLKVVALFCRQNQLEKDREGEVAALVALIDQHKGRPQGAVCAFIDEFFTAFLPLELDEATLNSLHLKQLQQMNMK